MTTKQTIDGVSRGLLERLLAVSGTVDHARALSELRALLDASEPVLPSGQSGDPSP